MSRTAKQDNMIAVDDIAYHTVVGYPSQKHDPPRYVLLCHALMSNMHMWDRTVEALTATGYTTLQFDHIGHNKTSLPEDDGKFVHTDDITRHMHALVEKSTGQTKVHAVLGCSVGGVLALRYGMMFPHDVRCVISVAAPGITSPEAAKSLWTQRIEQFKEDQQTGNDVLCQKTVERWVPGHRPRDDQVRADALVHVKTCSLRGYEILADAIRGYDYADDVVRIKHVRCFIIAGDEDSAISPAGLEELARKIDGCKYLLMEEAGHLPPMQKAEVFNKLVLDFIDA